MERRSAHRAVPLALVHHANQYLITDHYDNRQGITPILKGFSALLRLHDRYRIPANLHLSGTLIEAAAWHTPSFLALVRRLRDDGLLSLIGGTYGENVMPLFSAELSHRQLHEYLWLCERHLGCQPSDLQVCWVPERVWDTSQLGSVLTSETLPNGGYRYVLLDDRLVFPGDGGDPGSPRARFDALGPYGEVGGYDQTAGSLGALPPSAARRPYGIADGDDLVMVPIAADLRYCVPPPAPDALGRLDAMVAPLTKADADGTLLVYADDMEKTAGVGGWDPTALARYEAFLGWLSERDDVVAVHLPEWLDKHAGALEERVIEPGAFFELAQGWSADEDYRGWWGDPHFSPYRCYFTAAENALRAAEEAGAECQLQALGWKHLLASTYETAWHEPADTPGDRGHIAPWAKALASHARASVVIASAARWFGRPAGERPPGAEAVDLDGDGECEVVLRNERLFAVLTPDHGARLVYVFALMPEGGVLVVGNPTDDWNFLEALNSYMDLPANHPGALADAGAEHVRYRVTTVGLKGVNPFVEMESIEASDRKNRIRKTVLLVASGSALVVGYDRPDGTDALTTETCLSPDYYQLLREGRQGVVLVEGSTWRGARQGGTVAWVAIDADEGTTWEESTRPIGHGVAVRVHAEHPRFHLLLGVGEPSAAACAALLAEGKTGLARTEQAMPGD